MKKRTWLLGLFTLITIIICLVLIYNWYSDQILLGPCKLTYELNGKSYKGNICEDSNYSAGLNWLIENTQENSTILTLFDESQLIRAFAHRNTVIYLPSKIYANNYTGLGYLHKAYLYGKYEDEAKFKENILAFTTEDLEQTKSIMKKYNTNYIFLRNTDYGIFSSVSSYTGIKQPDCRFNDSRGYRFGISEIGKDDCFFNPNITYYNYQYCSKMVGGENKCFSSYNHPYCEKYIKFTFGNNCLNENSSMFKMLKLQNIDGFEKVYSDNYVVIYKIKE